MTFGVNANKNGVRFRPKQSPSRRTNEKAFDKNSTRVETSGHWLFFEKITLKQSTGLIRVDVFFDQLSSKTLSR